MDTNQQPVAPAYLRRIQGYLFGGDGEICIKTNEQHHAEHEEGVRGRGKETTTDGYTDRDNLRHNGISKPLTISSVVICVVFLSRTGHPLPRQHHHYRERKNAQSPGCERNGHYTQNNNKQTKKPKMTATHRMIRNDNHP